MYNITSRLPRYRTKHVVSWIFKNICYLLKRNCLKKRAVYPPTPKKAVTLERWGWGWLCSNFEDRLKDRLKGTSWYNTPKISP